MYDTIWFDIAKCIKKYCEPNIQINTIWKPINMITLYTYLCYDKLITNANNRISDFSQRN